MKREHIALVQESFSALQTSGKARIFAMRFYARLFLLDAPLYYLFPIPVEESEDTLLNLLACLITALDTPSLLQEQPAFRALLCNGTLLPKGWYHTVEDALLWALQKELGVAYTPMLREAWEMAYHVVLSAIARTHQDTERTTDYTVYCSSCT